MDVIAEEEKAPLELAKENKPEERKGTEESLNMTNDQLLSSFFAPLSNQPNAAGGDLI